MSSRLTRRCFVLGTTAFCYLVPRKPGPWAESVRGEVQSAPIRPVTYSAVTVTDSFWRSKMEKIAKTTLQACILYTERYTDRIRNFEKVARRQGEQHQGMFYDDSDVYKAIEAMAYSLNTYPDAALESKADDWIGKIAAAQQPDGYLNTYFTLSGLNRRWTDMSMHEDYCAGHLIEAAVAYYRTTGKRVLLDVATRFANHLDATFRVPNRHWVTGHEEIELALMKLYHLTLERRYLDLAAWYLDQRGQGFGRGQLWSESNGPDSRSPGGINTAYCQDNFPVKQQKRITGHAVRAMYLYCGAADVAAATGDVGYMEAMKSVWKDVVYRNMYVTGGIGSSGKNEGFTQDYDLPNSQAYCETCASVGMVFWNHRMAALTGESQYVDVLEKALYNGALDGLSLRGDRFFYGNPLASSMEEGQGGRSKWFGTACCPSNIARLVASIGGYFYAASDRNIWINLFATGGTRIKVNSTEVALRLTTQYPWDGKIRVQVDPSQPARFGLYLRIPGWVKAVASPGDLYQFTDTHETPIHLLLNGSQVPYEEEKGYAVVDREWAPGDVIELDLPMPVRQIVARNDVRADADRVAFQRGPLVYCIEGADNERNVWNFVATRQAMVRTQDYRVLDEPVMALSIDGSVLVPDGANVKRKSRTNIAIPYYAWANRDNYDMQVWIPTKVTGIKLES